MIKSRIKLSSALLYLITDRRLLFANLKITSEREACDKLLTLAKNAAEAGIDLFQLREKDLPTRDIYNLAERIVRIFETTTTSLLINDRFDIALAVGAQGVHLTTQSIDASCVREYVPNDFLIGVSVHSHRELIKSESYADFAVCGPVFDKPPKPTLGLDKFTQIVKKSSIPIIALGGISIENISQLLGTGAGGIAGIRLFLDDVSDPEKFKQNVVKLRKVLKSHG